MSSTYLFVEKIPIENKTLYAFETSEIQPPDGFEVVRVKPDINIFEDHIIVAYECRKSKQVPLPKDPNAKPLISRDTKGK